MIQGQKMHIMLIVFQLASPINKQRMSSYHPRDGLWFIYESLTASCSFFIPSPGLYLSVPSGVCYFFQMTWNLVMAVLYILSPENTNEKNVYVCEPLVELIFPYLNFFLFTSILTPVLISTILPRVYFNFLTFPFSLVFVRLPFFGAENSKMISVHQRY